MEQPFTLTCEGLPNEMTHCDDRTVEAHGIGRNVIMLCDPGRDADVRYRPLTEHAQLFDAIAFAMPDGTWYSTNSMGSDLCPFCIGAAPEMYREATDADIAEIDSRHAAAQ